MPFGGSGLSSAHLLGGVTSNILLLRDQAAKGPRLAAAAAVASPVELDNLGQQLLREISALALTLEADHDADGADSPLDAEDMLASFVAPSEATPGRTLAQQLVNLRRSFDEHYATVRYSGAGAAPWRDVESLQSLLDPETLLISLFLGTDADDHVAVQSQAITAGSFAAACTSIPFESSLIQMTHDGMTLTQSPLAVIVEQLRRHLVAEPDNLFDDVEAEAGAELRTGLVTWFGPFAARLSDWHVAGLNHLVIWPQGPLHYIPWHLYSCPGTDRVLAEDWAVTTIPALAVLGRPSTAATLGLVAIGCADTGLRYGLSRLSGVREQAAMLAELTGGIAVSEPHATVATVRSLIPHARYVHFAVHGSQVAEAPAFQCMYLTQDGDAGGRLFAYQIGEMDLRSVELVTLAACESALGRFDVGDNLRGIPAAFLTAGARAVIGAMWPAETAAALSFFTALYRALHNGRSVRDAFHDAQLATRATHSQYRDWGAFTFVGDGGTK